MDHSLSSVAVAICTYIPYDKLITYDSESYKEEDLVSRYLIKLPNTIKDEETSHTEQLLDERVKVLPFWYHFKPGEKNKYAWSEPFRPQAISTSKKRVKSWPQGTWHASLKQAFEDYSQAYNKKPNTPVLLRFIKDAKLKDPDAYRGIRTVNLAQCAIIPYDSYKTEETVVKKTIQTLVSMLRNPS